MRFLKAQNHETSDPETTAEALAEQAEAGVRSRRQRRSPLILGALSISAGLVLSGCVSTGEEDEGEDQPAASEEAEDPATEGGAAEESAEPSEDASDESSDQSSEEPSDDASEESSDDASESSDEATSDEEDGGAAASGDVVELSGLPDAEPAQSESGTGPGEFALEHPDGEDAPVYTSRSAGDGASYAYFTGVRTDGSEVDMGSVRGSQTGVGFEDPYWMDERITDVQVEAEDDAEWTFDVYSIDDIPEVSAGQSVKGDGSKVFHWTGDDSASFDVLVEADSNFIVKAETVDPDGPTPQTIFNEIGPGEGTMELPAEEYFITVHSSGPWEFTAK